MDQRLVALAVPLFFLAIALELALLRRAGVARGYRLHDALANLGCGVGQQASLLVLHGAFAWAYLEAYARLGAYDVPATSPWTWAVVLVAVDLAYYWFHRASHRVNVIWAGHAVHHQSEDMNLSVALRQSWLVAFFLWLFVLPLALVGVPPEVVIGCKTVNTLYQFWIHTELVGKLGPLEWVLNTASHHRVHHGVDPQYIDKNYGGILIVWDRLFGTFAPEAVRPTYGTVEPLRSWSPLWANVGPLVKLAQLSARAPGAWDKLRAWVMPPEWRPAALGGPVTIPPVPAGGRPRWETPAAPALDLYATVAFALGVLGTTWLLVAFRDLPPALGALGVALGLAGVTATGGLTERRAWAPALEAARLAGVVAFAAWAWGPAGLAPAGALALASLGWLAWAWRRAVAAPAPGAGQGVMPGAMPGAPVAATEGAPAIAVGA